MAQRQSYKSFLKGLWTKQRRAQDDHAMREAMNERKQEIAELQQIIEGIYREEFEGGDVEAFVQRVFDVVDAHHQVTDYSDNFCRAAMKHPATPEEKAAKNMDADLSADKQAEIIETALKVAQQRMRQIYAEFIRTVQSIA